MVSLASGMSIAFESEIPDISTSTAIPYSAGAVAEQFSLQYSVNSSEFPDSLPNLLLAELSGQGTLPTLERVRSSKDTAESILEFYKSGDGQLVNGGYEYSYQNISDGRDLLVTIVVEKSQDLSYAAVLLNAFHAASNRLIVPTTNATLSVYFKPFVSKVATSVSSSLVPPFLVYGISFFMAQWAAESIRELEDGHAQQLIVMGCSSLDYYLASYLTNGLVAFSVGIIAIIVLAAFQVYSCVLLTLM